MIIKSPSPIFLNFLPKAESTIFLAGSIDNGEVENWQDVLSVNIEKRFLSLGSKSNFSERINILNPRRENWSATTPNDITNGDFYHQIDWENQGLELADLIVFNFLPNSKSPITLLELGLYAGKKDLIICCPEGFYRKGNVDYIANKFKIPLVTDIKSLEHQIVMYIYGRKNNTKLSS